MRTLIPVVSLALAAMAAPVHAQSPELLPYRLGNWERDSTGTQRAVIQVDSAAPAVRVTIPWRRRDRLPDQKRVIVVAGATGLRVRDAVVERMSQEAGTIVFRPEAGPGEYYVYYLPYQGTFRSNYPRMTWRPPDSTAPPGWLAQVRSQAASLARARVVRFESVDSVNGVFPMEVIGTAAETARLRDGHPGAPFLLFAEDRLHPIRMRHQLPARWIAAGANGPVTGTALRGEFFAFQVGLWALVPTESVTVRFSELRGPGHVIPASAFSSFDTRGVDWEGRPFERRVDVDSGAVQALWFGVMVDSGAPPGSYAGSVAIGARGVAPAVLPVRLTVRDSLIADHGDDDPWRLSRLRWLDSRLALDTSVVRPYTPVTVHGRRLEILGREVELAASGLPAAIGSRFDAAMTGYAKSPRQILAGPVRLEVTDRSGRAMVWRSRGPVFTKRKPGAAGWESISHSGPLALSVHGELEFDGTIEYTVGLTTSATLPVSDVRLDLPFRRDVARYFMGLGRKGGTAPTRYAWQWDVTRNQDAVWIGDVNAGLQLTLKDQHYIRPLNTNFYQLRPLVMPESWSNGGLGGCRFAAEAAVYRARCFGGPRTLSPGDTVWFNLRLLVTPFHSLDPAAHFAARYYHAYRPVDTVAAAGANVINVHHATAINPYINYPFLRPAAMKAYVDSAHAAGMRVKIYYTVRELTYRAPEFWALRSLGHEVFAGGPGGGHAWLQQHVVRDYIPGWVVPDTAIRDIALVTSGISRWHNHYVEGLNWLVRHVGIDGLYLDDVAFDRVTMQRIRRVLERGRPHPLIDLHSANQFNPRDGYASSANLYLEHFPYIDRLWFGEYFDYNSAPDYWLVEMSGIPFGLMGEMLQDGGNPWRGMVFGMTSRLPWAGDPRPLWKAWDAFGIEQSRMIGWWAPGSPVTTGRPDVLATSYVRAGRTLVALASWAPDTVRVRLRINWKGLGLDPAHVAIAAPAIDRFQPAGRFSPDGPIPIAPGKGWLLELSQSP